MDKGDQPMPRIVNEWKEQLTKHVHVQHRLKEMALQLCTCTWIEILTCIGITAYLVLVIQDIGLAAITAGLFSPLIVFHFAVTKTTGKNDFVNIHRLKFKNPNIARD